MNYDHWKTTNPADEFLGPDPEDQDEEVEVEEPAPSPFLPGTKLQYAWDSTSLGWLKTCPRLYQYNMIEGRRPRGDQVHLRFGIYVHSGLEHYDRLRAEGMDHQNALVEVVGKLLRETWDPATGQPWEPDHATKTRSNLIRTVVWYLDQFSDDPAQTIVLENGKPAVELSFRMELDWGPTPKQPYLLCGHLDRLVTFQDATYVMDRKTTGHTITGRFWEQFNPDNQMSLYTIAAQVVYKVLISGIIIDGMQVAVGFSRFERGFSARTQLQTEEWLKDLRYWLHQAESFAKADYWPMNDKACNLYGGCSFRDICSKDPSVREVFLESNFGRSPWNPLEPR